MKILLVGAGGQLGRAFRAAAGLVAGHVVVPLTRADVDVTDGPALADAVARARPDAVINCAAYTNVDGAEDEPARAVAVNALAVRTLARAAADARAALVHFSTDFVFDGDVAGPHDESIAPNPRGAYAMSKLLGEWFAAAAPRHYVLRVESLFGAPGGAGSIDTMRRRITEGVEVPAFSDRTVSPSHVDDVVRASIALVERRAPFGVYHCVNTGQTTWLNLAREIARLAGRPDARITPTRMADVKLRAPRPLHAALSNAKLRALGIEMPTWQDALARYMAD